MIGSLTRRQRRPLWGWLTFLLLFAVSASLFMAMRAKDRALDAASADARLAAQTELATLLESRDLLTPVVGEHALELGAGIDAQITSVSPIDEVRIYSSLGRILYADDPVIVGTRPSYLRNLTFAVASGEAETQVRGDVLQTLVPIRLTPGGTVVVAELSQPTGPIVSSATATWYWIAVACGVLLVGAAAMIVVSSQAKPTTAPMQVHPAAGHARAPVYHEPARPAAPQVDTREIEMTHRAAEQRAEAAEQNLRAIQRQLKEALDRNAAVEARLVAADSTTHTSDSEVASLRERLSETTERLNAAELDATALRERLSLRTRELEEAQGELASVRATTEAVAELRLRVETAEGRASAEAERANAAEERLQQALERAFALEARLDDTGAEPVVKGPRQLSVIVDDRREELREAVATEIRRPLTSIMRLTLAMKHADPSSSNSKRMVRRLGADARRLERLVVQMIDLDGIANGTFVPNTRRVDLKAIVRRVVEETPDIAELDVHVHAEHAAVEIDPALTEQMVEILLANAARRNAPLDPVWVQVSADRAGAIIAVDDTCAEIPAGLQVRGSASDPDGSGAGRKRPKGSTGLALLSRLAELQGGKAWVEQRSGGGASFRVFFPSASQEPHLGTPDASATPHHLEDDHDYVVVDATSVGSSSLGSPSVTDQLRELSSFDDLSDEVAI